MSVIKYGVLNPKTGETTIHDTKEEALMIFWTRMVDFAGPYFHNSSYTIVEQHDDGTETWSNDQNEEIQKPRTLQEIEEFLAQTKEIANNINLLRSASANTST